MCTSCIRLQVSGNCIERYLHLSQIYSKVRCAPYLFAFKSVETCIRRYWNLSWIYTEVMNVHPIYSMIRSEGTFVVRIFIHHIDGHTFIFYRWNIFHPSYQWTYIHLLSAKNLHLSYWWTYMHLLSMNYFHRSTDGHTLKILSVDILFLFVYWWTCIQNHNNRSSCLIFLPMNIHSKSYRWMFFFLFVLTMDIYSKSYRLLSLFPFFYQWTYIQNMTDGSSFFIHPTDEYTFKSYQVINIFFRPIDGRAFISYQCVIFFVVL